MSRYGQVGPAWVLTLSFLLLLLTFSGIAAAVITRSSGPNVNDGATTIGPAALNGGSRLSGLRSNTITATYQSPLPNSELMVCAGSGVRYTVNGTTPTTSSPFNQATCNNTGGVGGTTLSMTVVLTVGNLSAAPADGLVTFRIEIARPNQAKFIDDNGGQFFKYRLDKSQGVLVDKSPAPLENSTIPDAVTDDNEVGISFRLQDDDRESALNVSSIVIRIDGSDRTSAFVCDAADAFRYDCELDPDLLVSGFPWSEGTHTVKVDGQDMTKNDFNATGSRLVFRVDQTDPSVDNVTATAPATGGTSNGLPIVSRGANVTVLASVKDTNMNLNATQDVFGQLFNASVNQVSPFFPMMFNKTSNKWEGNATVPLTWPQQAFGVAVRVKAADQAGNEKVNTSAADQFILDPVLPVITLINPPGSFILDTPTRITAMVTDQGSGVNPDEVKITFTNTTGHFKTTPTATKVGDGNNSFEAKMTRVGATDNYTYDIPAAEPNTTITWQVRAKDKAGGPVQTPVHIMAVDVTGPTIIEVNQKGFRGPVPMTWEATISDAGAGVNTTNAKLFYTTSGSFQSANLVRDATTGSYKASISPSVTDGQELRYYFEAKDLLGNVGRNGTSTNPNKVKIDLVAPTISGVTAPATSSGPTFTVSWTGTDSSSGIDTYTVEARVNDGTPTVWVAVLQNTKDTSLSFCGEGGHKYEFRVSATDVAGNKGTPPANPQAATQLSGAGCAEEVLVSVISPAAGSVIDAKIVDNYKVRWSANSTRTFTPSAQLAIDIQFSPDGQFWSTVKEGAPNTGEFFVAVDDLPTCTACKVRIVAHTLSGVTKEATSGAFTLKNANAEADLDGNGLPDAWEVQYYGTVGTAKPGDDDDGDKLSNAEEAALGTDPENKDTDNDGASDYVESRVGRDPLDALDVPTTEEARTDEYTNWYWTVPGIFLATTILFFVGLARRW